jgi:hypothetical protein
MGIERRERGCESLEVLWIGGRRDIEILGRSSTSMHLRGNPTDHQIVDAMFGEHPKQLVYVQRALRSFAHDDGP